MTETPAAGLPRAGLSWSGLRCGEAALESFGVTVRGPRRLTCWGAAASRLQRAGCELARETAPWDARVTLAAFIAAHPDGDWLIGTHDHVMSLRDGRLTDTDLGGSGRRMVREAYRVTVPAAQTV
jgi:hypothetical protein